MILTILNWEKFNGRPDYKKSCSWFRMENRFALDPEHADLNAEQKWVWVFLLSYASFKAKPTLDINIDAVARFAGVKTAILEGTIQLLEKKAMISTSTRIGTDPDGSDRIRCPTNERTIRTNERTLLTDSRPPSAIVKFRVPHDELESIYQQYPRKEGKTQGLERLRKRLRSAEDLKAFGEAVSRYAEHVRESGVETRFVKHFSSFVGSPSSGEPWKDWLDKETGKSLDADSIDDLDLGVGR